jgi:hypothetical protein
MSMTVTTGTMKQDDVQLALYRYYVDAHEQELKEQGISREEVLSLVRSLDTSSGYRTTELATIAEQIIHAYIAGRNFKPST